MRPLRWLDFITLNVYWAGLNVSAGVITPVLLPYLVASFVPDGQKNTSLAMVRVVGLAVAMLVQPTAGLLSDRSTHPWGRRRPFILFGTLADLVFLALIGLTPELSGAVWGVSHPFLILLLAIALLQVSSNFAQGALQGLIPDVVPEDQRGRASGVKAVMELLPILVVLFMGPLVDAGRIWLTVALIGLALTLTMAMTLGFVREPARTDPPTGRLRPAILRFAALTLLFVGATQGAVALVGAAGEILAFRGLPVAVQGAVLGMAGLLGMVLAILVGVYFGARVGLGVRAAPPAPPGARLRRREEPASRGKTPSSFVWWVINRLLFLAAVGSIQGFAQYYLSDVLRVERAATTTTLLLGVVAAFLLPAAVGGGALADRIGQRRLVALAGLVAAAGTFVLLAVRSLPGVLVGGAVIGLGTGTFMATNWALGTRLAPPHAAGRYLGVSNLAGAGAGIVGAGIGGPLADALNRMSPGFGYLVIYAIYGLLFLLSVVALRGVREPAPAGSGWRPG